MTERRFSFVLFALTGLGNVVLERLVESGYAPDVVITRAEAGPYPYEPIPFIGDVACRLGLPCMIGADGEEEVARHGAEFILLATYHRRIGASIVSRCGMAINLHPSLLPRNRGANPFFWSIRNGDNQAGVTAHLLSEQLDAGDICVQQSIPIDAGETQSTLRHKLGILAADTAVNVVRGCKNNNLRFHPQSESEATSHPRIDDRQRQLDLTESSAAVMRHVNALRDWPLALLGDRRVLRVLDILPPTRAASVATVLASENAICRVRTADTDLVLQLG